VLRKEETPRKDKAAHSYTHTDTYTRTPRARAHTLSLSLSLSHTHTGWNLKGGLALRKQEALRKEKAEKIPEPQLTTLQTSETPGGESWGECHALGEGGQGLHLTLPPSTDSSLSSSTESFPSRNRANPANGGTKYHSTAPQYKESTAEEAGCVDRKGSHTATHTNTHTVMGQGKLRSFLLLLFFFWLL
jgi:hypothetical protein